MAGKSVDGAVCLYHYCIVRKDIPFGNQCAQLIHAAGESVKDPVPNSTHAVALHAESEADLIALESSLNTSGVCFVSIREPDCNNELMAIGLLPQVRTKQLRKFMCKFALIKE